MKKPSLYYYRAIVVSVNDGDTCTVDIDLELNIWSRGEKIRLIRINAPELQGKERPRGLPPRAYSGQTDHPADHQRQEGEIRSLPWGNLVGRQ